MEQAIPRPRRTRWWPAAVIVAVALVAAIWVHFSEQVDDSFRVPFTALIVVVAGLLLGLWFLFFTGLRWRTRLITVGTAALLLIAAGFAIRHTARVEGSISGRGIPRLAWKWSKPADPVPAGAAVTIADAPASHADLATTRPTDFPQFLGANRDNIARTGTSALARDWSASPPKQLWRQPIGLGWSGFVVVNDSAVTQEQRGGEELITCYELTTGKPRWAHANAVRFSEPLGGDGPRATPTIDAGRVYAMGATGILDCLDGSTGKPVWTREVLADAGNAGNVTWGKSCSPLVENGLVIVTGGDGGPDLIAYRADTGQPAWRGRAQTPAYTSATAATIGGVRQVITFTEHGVSGYRLADGKPLWEYPWEAGFRSMAQPVPLPGDRVFLSIGYGYGSAMLGVPPLDENSTAAPVAAKALWTNKRLRAKFQNVAVRDGFIYGLDNGTIVCLDVQTGDRKWRGDSYGYGQLLLADDLLIVQSEDGKVALVEAKPDAFKELGSFQALAPGPTCWNPPALAGRRLLVRNSREAACYELPMLAGGAVARNR